MTTVLLWLGVLLACSMLVAVASERIVHVYQQARSRMIAQRYGPLIERALGGDLAARRALIASPPRDRLGIAWLLVPLVLTDANPDRVAPVRDLFQTLSLVPIAERLLRSRFWWRRAMGLRALGGFQIPGYTAAIVAALDDPNEDVRGAALDAIADLRDPAALPALIARLHDVSLHRGRRGAALAAFGPRCEPLLLEWAPFHFDQRANYAHALGICGTARARPVLSRWTTDPRPEVRAAALEALAHVGLDARAVPYALEALESSDAPVRAMAAFALHGWTGSGHAAAKLARHLDDTWDVAVRAARSLQSMRESGLAELRRSASRPGTAGLLARQMVWESRAA